MKNVHVIHHTHWDFEWYFTNNESLIQFIYHMDEVLRALENNDIDFYVLDGQMSILEEYLEYNPSTKERLQRLVREGKLLVGPWYTQTDELIIAGESIIRNLNLGMNFAQKLGKVMMIGYLPDSFGQGQDMPKIYNGVGIDRAIFWRGVPESKTKDREFIWRAEDGSEVVVANIKNGYFVGVELIYSSDADALIEVIGQGATGDNLLLPVGGDQRYIDFNLRDRIDLYNTLGEGRYQLKESTFDDFFKTLDFDKLNTVEGEFISGSVSKIHRSIYSSRYDHKYMNDKIERRLVYQLEPLMYLAEKVGIEYKQELIDNIWKILLRNHAHDSTGGCNSDKTNRIISERFVEADQLSYSTIDYLTRKIAESRQNIHENELVVFNTLPALRKKLIKTEVSTAFKAFKILYQGKKIEFDVLETKKEYSGSIRKDSIDEEKFYYIHKIAFEMELEGFSYTVLEIEEEGKSQNLNHDDPMIENDRYRITFENGKINLIDKDGEREINDVMWIEDDADDGDTYDFSPLEGDTPLQFYFDDASYHVTKGKCVEQLIIKGVWKIPENLKSRKTKEKMVEINYELRLELGRGSAYVDIHLIVDNTAYDHRMRIIFNSGLINQYSYANTPFGYVIRDVVDANLKEWKELGWKEEPTAIFPMVNYVNAHDRNNSVTVFSKGIKEYQFTGENYENIALTLYRSVGYLGKPDLIRRPGIASGNEFKYIPTPDSQLLGKLHFKIALEFTEIFNPIETMESFVNYAVSVPTYQIQEMNRFTSTLKYFVSNPLPEKVSEFETLNINTSNITVSSMRKNNEYNGLELRIFNPSKDFLYNINVVEFTEEKKYCFLNLANKQISEVYNGQEIIISEMKPGEIQTLLIF